MTQSLKKIALVVTLGTFISKLGGLARQLLIAGVFGVGAAYDAYNYAYIVPGFFLILLGGINGPFHNSMVTILSKVSKEEKSYVLSAINTIACSFLILITIILFVFSGEIIKIIGPGLTDEICNIATNQLRIMSPIALFAGLIGLGFGALNATEEFLIPSISPLISSLTLILFIGIFWSTNNILLNSYQSEFNGGLILALGTLFGALIQYIFQIPFLFKRQLLRVKFIWDWKNEKVKEVLKILAPATISAGMLQINVFTDLFFASEIIGAASGLSYATFIIQAPLGLISNALLIPLLPTYAKLSESKDRISLIYRIRQGLILSTASMIALGAIFIALSDPLVELIYKRGAFNNNAVSLVSGILIAYGIGMPAYLSRDLLIRIFYSFGDGKTPFKISTIGILLNIVFDWILIGGPTPWGEQFSFNFGAQGLVFATAIVNLISCAILIYQLNLKLNGIPILNWIKDIIKLLISGFIAGSIAWCLQSLVIWPIGFLGLTIEVIISSSIGLAIFGLLGISMGIKEVNDLRILMFKKIIHL